MIMKGIFTYDRWGMLQRFVGKFVEYSNYFDFKTIWSDLSLNQPREIWKKNTHPPVN